MGGFVRDILTTLSYEPDPAEASRVEGAELSRLDQRLAGFVQGEMAGARRFRSGLAIAASGMAIHAMFRDCRQTVAVP